MKKLLPLVFLFIGIGAGVGAGIFLRPDVVVETAHGSEPDQGEAAMQEGEEAHKAEDHGQDKTEAHNDEKDDGSASTNEYAKMNNQFVIPLVAGDKVTALVVLALSVEVPEGETAAVYLREPKLRDSFLQVLFDHANMGGFEGNFTNAQALGRLRDALREVGQKDLGKDLVRDVLIMEIARQDY